MSGLRAVSIVNSLGEREPMRLEDMRLRSLYFAGPNHPDLLPDRLCSALRAPGAGRQVPFLTLAARVGQGSHSERMMPRIRTDNLAVAADSAAPASSPRSSLDSVTTCPAHATSRMSRRWQGVLDSQRGGPSVRLARCPDRAAAGTRAQPQPRLCRDGGSSGRLEDVDRSWRRWPPTTRAPCLLMTCRSDPLTVNPRGTIRIVNELPIGLPSRTARAAMPRRGTGHPCLVSRAFRAHLPQGRPSPASRPPPALSTGQRRSGKGHERSQTMRDARHSADTHRHRHRP